MKKLMTILLSVLLILSLAACGGNEQNGDDPLNREDDTTQQTQGGTENPGNTEYPGDGDLDIDFGSIMAGNGDTGTVLGEQSAADRQAILDAARENGLDASFGADGSFTIKDPESGVILVQKPDGTWNFQNEDGGEGQFGGNWPENEFTKLLPKPDFTLLAAYGDGETFNINFESTTLEQIRAYVEKVKAKGFTVDAEIIDQSFQGVMIFSYTASNAGGYSVQIVAASGQSCITITAP